jgi:Ferritin-like domain
MTAQDGFPAGRLDAVPPTSAAADRLAPQPPIVGRRSFLKVVGVAGASAIPASALLASQAMATSDALTRGDAAILRFVAAAELIEADLWQQYDELGGVNGGNAAYVAALTNIDGDMPTYVHLNNVDEQSHAAFLNAYLRSKGAEPVNLDAFRTLPSSKATGAKRTGRLTSLTALDVDTSWYTRYRSAHNPDFGAKFPQAIKIHKQPAIPISDTDTPPNMDAPLPPATPAQRRMQVIACTAAFHFGYIEQGGSSLYATLINKASSAEVVRIMASIGGSESQHFATWSDDASNAANDPVAPVTDPVSGLTIPNLAADPRGALVQPNLIFPTPCEFISRALPHCAIVRPTLVRDGGAVATIKSFTADHLFDGQSSRFFRTIMDLAREADAVGRHAD